MQRLNGKVYKTDRVGNWMAKLDTGDIVVLAGSGNGRRYFADQRVWVENLREMGGERPRPSWPWASDPLQPWYGKSLDSPPTPSFRVMVATKYGLIDGESNEGGVPGTGIAREKTVIRTEPYKPGGELDGRIERALSGADMAGISTLVLYDPSPGGVRDNEYFRSCESWEITRPNPQRYHVIVLSKDGQQHGQAINNLPELLHSSLVAAQAEKEGRAGMYHVDSDFRSAVKESPKKGDILFMPIPGLVYKQQWGPAHSQIEPGIMAVCLAHARF